ncbi:LEAF RUST 10 DISEASE-RESISTANCEUS RECEPTOR-LIKE PROTEIN KINASE-like 2.3 isoform X3 [Elaeis guineensis]|uniref:LEAF RUST 10 DISEASE-RESISTANCEUS RECEPTOR-LIKE PROTEIN KINASE-like 2.3 isoform X3 n=1 Tax=Elaeis guineensis var. tenera TaxID=51953 RepID=UPI003C6D1AC4
MYHSYSLLSPILLLMLSLLSKADNGTLFIECVSAASYDCGRNHYNITYPFRLLDSPEKCGLPGFELACNTDQSLLTINMGKKSYRIKSIDYANRVLTIIDPDLTGEDCPRTFTDPIINSSIFSYARLDFNLSFYFNCTFDPSLDGFHPIACPTGGIQPHSYYSLLEQPPLGQWNPLGCSSMGIFPINRTIHELLWSGKTFGEAMQEGISVTWTVGQRACQGCQDSGKVDPRRPTGAANCADACGGSKSSKKRIIIGSAAVTGGLLLACLLSFLYLYQHEKLPNSIFFWRRKSDNSQHIKAFLERYGSLAPKKYRYKDVKRITRKFHEKLGQGGYGTVFKGSLMDGRLVAVKILSDSKGDGEEFINEVASIGRTSHVNIVSLLGFSSEGSKRALIYEYMPNGSLDKYIYSEKSILGLEILYQIAIGVAQGLEYLHRGCNTRIVHFDIKPHNILLDQEFCPKISDFGLAKLCPPKISILSMADPRGTIGFIAPEVFSRNFGVVSSKSDVYSYGMMVLEMVGGRKNLDVGAGKTSEIYFPHWIYKHIERDGNLQAYGVTAETEEIARKMILVGLWCIQTQPESRPSMSKVVDMLQGSLSDLQVPPDPVLSSPQGSLIDSSAETTH